MGLRASALRLLLPHLPAESVLSLSYPDLMMTQKELRLLTGFETNAVNTANKWHKLPDPMPETVECFTKLGTKHFVCVDAKPSRGVEKVCDLNYPHDLGQHDLVIDPGTTEHCFNVGQALANAANAVKVGGVILHTPPLTSLNHGFYCLMPTLFHDFYGQNGWEILHLSMTDGFNQEEVARVDKFSAKMGMNLYCLARRLRAGAMTFPMQTKYLRFPTLGG